MTSNIINYLSHVEKGRTNLANEQLRNLEHRETQRHNRAVEMETERRNRALESLQAQQQAETARANLASEYLRKQSVLVDQRNSETQSRRASNDFINYLMQNRVNEERNQIQARYNTGQLAIAKSQTAETQRHNEAMERYNLTSLAQNFELQSRALSNQERQTAVSEYSAHQQAERWYHQSEVDYYNAGTRRKQIYSSLLQEGIKSATQIFKK